MKRYGIAAGLIALALAVYAAMPVPGPGWDRYGLIAVTAHNRLGSLNPLTDGQILVGDTGAVPVAKTGCLTVLAASINPTEASATNDFVNLLDNTISTTEANENLFTVPIAMVAHSLKATVDVAPGAGNDPWAITVRDDVASSTITCTIDEAAVTCDSGALRANIAAGSRLAVLVSSAGGDSDPDAAARLDISFCLGM